MAESNANSATTQGPRGTRLGTDNEENQGLGMPGQLLTFNGDQHRKN